MKGRLSTAEAQQQLAMQAQIFANATYEVTETTMEAGAAMVTVTFKLKRGAAAHLGELQFLGNRLGVRSSIDHDIPCEARARRIGHGMTSCMGIDCPSDRIEGRMNILG